MHLTYDDLEKARIKVKESNLARIELLKKEAGELVKEYRASLHTTSDSWMDGNIPKGYAQTFSLNEKNNYQPKSLKDLRLVDNRYITFFIGTVIDISVKGGEWIYIPVKISLNNNRIIFELPGGSAHEEVLVASDNNKYFDCCRAIKEEVLRNIHLISED